MCCSSELQLHRFDGGILENILEATERGFLLTSLCSGFSFVHGAGGRDAQGEQWMLSHSEVFGTGRLFKVEVLTLLMASQQRREGRQSGRRTNTDSSNFQSSLFTRTFSHPRHSRE